MQRLGFLKYLVWKASHSATNNLSTLGKDLIDTVSQKVSVWLTPQLQEYINSALTDSVYKSLRVIASKPLDESLDQPLIQLELQDLFLADLGIPSRRGRLVKEDWRRYPYLAVHLGLLRSGTYSILVRGMAFLSLVSEEEINSFAIIGNARSYNRNANPLRLDSSQKLLLLFSFLNNDGETLEELYKKLLSISEPFAEWEAGNYLGDIYQQIAKRSRLKARSGDDLLTIQRILDTANKIESWKRRPYKGRGARDEAITLRLEPFVDLGLLSKPDPLAYRYQITDSTRKFFEPLINAESIEPFLQNSFFEASNRAFNLNAEHRTDREIILPQIQKAYSTLKSPLGYAPILEVSLLAGIYAITESGAYFELSESLDTLKSLQKESPELVRFNVDRWGALTYVKFNGDVVKTLKG